MLGQTFTSLTILLLAFNGTAAALSVRSADLPLSVGFLRIEEHQESDEVTNFTVLSNRFEEFRTAPSTEVRQKWMQDLEASSQTAPGSRFFYFEPPSGNPSESNSVLDDPKTGRYFTIWSDRGYEGSRHPIVVWKKRKEFLDFEAVLNMPLVASIGAPELKEIVHLEKGRHLLIGRNEGGDGGDTWGSVWVGLWTEPRDLRLIYETSYQGDMSGDQKVEYHYNPSTRSIRFKKYATKYRDGQAADDPEEWKLEKDWTVSLKEKIK